MSSTNDAVYSSDDPPLGLHTRACTNCVRAKAKCTVAAEIGGTCERCYRMKKHCQPSPPMRKRRMAKRSQELKTSKLEEKLDGLVTFLKSAAQVGPGTISATNTASLIGFPSPSNVDGVIPTAVTSATYQGYPYNNALPQDRNMHESSSAPISDSSGLTPARSQTVPCPAVEYTLQNAEACLEKFRTAFLKHMPFLVIPPFITAHQLQKERPILWLSIITVTATSTMQQIKYTKEIRETFAREAYVEGTRNIDFLLAILVYITWDRRQCLEIPISTSLVQLAIAIVYDLGLDRPSKDAAFNLEYDPKGVGKPSRLSRHPTMEERRALLGCFLISSITFYCLRKGEALRWTTYSDECLQIIETQMEFVSDALLVQLVKLRLINERAIDTPLSCAMPQASVIPQAVSLGRPMGMFYLRSLEKQLQEFKSGIPNHLASNEILLMELYITEVSIYDIGFSQAPDLFNGRSNQRIECLCACLHATKSWMEIFLRIPPAQYVGFSTSFYKNSGRCFMGMYRLLTFDHIDWDRELARETLGPLSFLEQAEKNFSLVKDVVGFDLEGSDDVNPFSFKASAIRNARASLEAAIAFSKSTSTAQSDEMNGIPLEMFDYEWLRDLFDPWSQ